MEMLWPQWLRPFWLLLLPLLGWLLWQLWHRERRSGRWQLLLPAAFQAVLLTAGRARSNKLPWIALGLAWLLTLLAAVGGPVAYLIGERLGAITFQEPTFIVVSWMVPGWLVLMLFFHLLMGRQK